MRIVKIFIIILSIVSLVMVRTKESLFYDPFLIYFKQNNPLYPDFDNLKMSLSLLLRYSINTILSLIVIQLWFGKIKTTLFCFIIYIACLIIFLPIYMYSVNNNLNIGYMPTFYIRRILIQPLLLLLLIPTIYYNEHLKKD